MEKAEEEQKKAELQKACDEHAISNEEADGIAEFLENDDTVPDEIKQIMRKISITQGSFSVPNVDPLKRALSEKLQPEHIDKFLDIAKVNEENEYKDRISSKKDIRLFVLLGVAVFVFLVIFLKSNTDLLMSILRDGFAFIGGFGAGSFYNWKKNKKD